MAITGKVLFNKIRYLRPDHSTGITAEILEKVCEESAVQPFLEWFCKNVSQRNVLSDNELKTKNMLQKGGEWLEGSELDNALEQAIKEYPELSKLTLSQDGFMDNLHDKLKVAEEAEQEDEEYIQMLQSSLQKLKIIQNKLEEDIEEETTLLQKEQIDVGKAWQDCCTVLQEFDRNNREFSQDVEELVGIYADAAENKGVPVTWTQMPLDLFVKQVELYDSYLAIYIKRQFGNQDQREQETDSDYASLINDSKEKANARELQRCETNIASAKIKEVMARIREKSLTAIIDYVHEIYNDGNVKVPKQNDLRREIMELIGKRDSLEENIDLLRDRQLTDAAQQFASAEIAKALKYATDARVERRRARLEKVRNLEILVRDKGHVHADLLCILMEIQCRLLNDVLEFVADARHYLATEYSHSSARCENMQRTIQEYTTLTSHASKGLNTFEKIFNAMVCGDDAPQNLNIALEKYNGIMNDNRKHELKSLMRLNSRINELNDMQHDANLSYTNETQQGPTCILKSVSFETSVRHDEASRCMQTVHAELTKTRKKLKERMRTDTDLERERDILWQRFLASPETLIATYATAKRKADKIHFGNS